MMKKINFLLFSLFSISIAHAQLQEIKLTSYEISSITLPSELNNEVSISGMKYFNGNLYLASERCPEIFVVNPADGKVKVKLQLSMPHRFENEAITSYGNHLYIVSESDVAVYEVNPTTAALREIQTSIPLPPKSKHGDGMEGIAGNEKQHKMYLLRERNNERTNAEIYTFNVTKKNGTTYLNILSKIDIPLESNDWRYSDICFDQINNRLLCLKSFSGKKTRRHFIEAFDLDSEGSLIKGSLHQISSSPFSSLQKQFGDDGFSVNMEGLTMDDEGNIYVVSDNTSGKAHCNRKSKEKTLLLRLREEKR
ncbi:MAG: SdiA-regulated domain-containing protein [Chitinophagaceae bacterium]